MENPGFNNVREKRKSIVAVVESSFNIWSQSDREIQGQLLLLLLPLTPNNRVRSQREWYVLESKRLSYQQIEAPEIVS